MEYYKRNQCYLLNCNCNQCCKIWFSILKVMSCTFLTLKWLSLNLYSYTEWISTSTIWNSVVIITKLKCFWFAVVDVLYYMLLALTIFSLINLDNERNIKFLQSKPKQFRQFTSQPEIKFKLEITIFHISSSLFTSPDT